MTPPHSRDTIYQSSCGDTNAAGIMIFVVGAISDNGNLHQASGARRTITLLNSAIP
jgi:hypothetical protein